jgi:hypothetical protein
MSLHPSFNKKSKVSKRQRERSVILFSKNMTETSVNKYVITFSGIAIIPKQKWIRWNFYFFNLPKRLKYSSLLIQSNNVLCSCVFIWKVALSANSLKMVLHILSVEQNYYFIYIVLISKVRVYRASVIDRFLNWTFSWTSHESILVKDVTKSKL